MCRQQKKCERTHHTVTEDSEDLTTLSYIASNGVEHICHTTEGACVECKEDCAFSGLEEVTWVSGRDGTEHSCMTTELECAYCTNEDCPYCTDYDW